MKNILFALLVAGAVSIPFTAGAQTDAENILNARKATDITHNCYEAMRLLEMISAEGKKKEDYFLAIAKAHDCKSNKEQAIYYYKKYLESEPGSDSVKKRVAELSDQATEQARVANQESMIKATYESAKKKAPAKRKHGHNHLNIHDNYGTIGISGDIALGGADAPYKKGLTAIYVGGYPIIHNHVVLAYSLTSGCMFSPNLPWFGKVFGMPASQVAGVGLGLCEELSFIPMAVILNKHKLSVSAGPKIGFGFFYTPEPSQTYGGAASFNDAGDFGLAYGLRANLFLGDYLGLSIDYSASSIRSVTAELSGGTYSTPVSRSMLHLGVSYRFDNRHWFGWW